MVVMLALGCTDELTADLDLTRLDCSKYDNSFYCSDGIAHINETIDIRCIHYIANKCYSNEFVIVRETNWYYSTAQPPIYVNSTSIKRIPKPTLVTGYNHSEKGFWYPLRGTWIRPNNFIVNNTIDLGNILFILKGCDNVTIRYVNISAKLSIKNSTNIVVAYANITRKINITNLNNFKLLGSNDALYYINETPVSETVVNDTIVFAPLIEPEILINLTAAPDDNIRSITWDYHYANKTWKYFTLYNATCHQIPCNFSGAYCLECEEIH